MSDEKKEATTGAGYWTGLDMREAFEKCYMAIDFTRDGFHYKAAATETLWHGWRDGWRVREFAAPLPAASPPPAQEPVGDAAAIAAFRAAQSVYRGNYDEFPLRNTWENVDEAIRDGWRKIAIAAQTEGRLNLDALNKHVIADVIAPYFTEEFSANDVAEIVLRHLLKDAPSPSPSLTKAREADTMFGITGATSAQEALAIALFNHRCPGVLMQDEDFPHYEAAAKLALSYHDEAP